MIMFGHEFGGKSFLFYLLIFSLSRYSIILSQGFSPETIPLLAEVIISRVSSIRIISGWSGFRFSWLTLRISRKKHDDKLSNTQNCTNHYYSTLDPSFPISLLSFISSVAEHSSWWLSSLLLLFSFSSFSFEKSRHSSKMNLLKTDEEITFLCSSDWIC